MGLERIGEAYISKTGKSVMAKVTDDPRTVFTWYFCINKQALQELLQDKRATVPIMLIKR